MTLLAQFTALVFAVAAALLASAPLMLLLDRSVELESTTTVVTALLVALAVPALMALLSWRLIKAWQPQSLWLVAVSSGLVLAGVAALAL